MATIVFSARIVLKPDLDPKTGWLDIHECTNAHVLDCGCTALLHIVFLGEWETTFSSFRGRDNYEILL